MASELNIANVINIPNRLNNIRFNPSKMKLSIPQNNDSSKKRKFKVSNDIKVNNLRTKKRRISTTDSDDNDLVIVKNRNQNNSDGNVRGIKGQNSNSLSGFDFGGDFGNVNNNHWWDPIMKTFQKSFEIKAIENEKKCQQGINGLKKKTIQQENLIQNVRKQFNDLQRQYDNVKKKVETEIGTLESKVINQQNIMEDLLDQNAKMKKENQTLKAEIDVCYGRSNTVEALGINVIKEKKIKLKRGMKLLSEARDRLEEEKHKCIACKDNKKNIIFNDGCNHLVFCNDCVAKNESKRCPTCRTPYTQIRMIIS